jgi:ADP-dependent NAD(P)H-hydrate dehydratase / NAD(P)H-hydrate epimerase
MDQRANYWHKQTPAAPLFPDLQWSRPENRLLAGKLLIVGGNVHGFTAAAAAYGLAETAGIGTSRVLLPDVLQKTVRRIFPAAEYAPSTPSGSFSQKALGELLPLSAWADGVLLAGDLGRNSETAILLEKFITSYSGQITLTRDAADYFTTSPRLVLERPDTLLVISFAQLQKLAMEAKYPAAFTFDMDLLRLIDQLHDFSLLYPLAIIVRHLDNLIVAVDGEVSTTKVPAEQLVWRLHSAARASVWWLQQPTKGFAALSTAVIDAGE